MGIFSRKDGTALTEAIVLNELRKIQDPDLHRDVVSLGFIKNLQIHDGTVGFDFVLTTPACPAKDVMRDDAIRLLSALPGVESVKINMQAEVKTQPTFSQNAIEGIKNVIAICS